MKHLSCHGVGVDCEASFEAETEEELMELAAKHAAEEHNLSPIPPQVMAQCCGRIQDR